ncbi:hypothetical protein KM043_007508 [Ampulex compressa]|nr:hypothetical protein KM043_007508 [Ampulex compressa]
MHRNLAAFPIVLALVLAVRSDETLKCYMCTSLTNEGCGTDPKAHNLEPVECTLSKMGEWQRNIQQHNILNSIASIFEVDNTQNYPVSAPKDLACAKMVLKVAGQDVTVRSCQIAKTETIDPCKAIQGKLSNNLLGSMEHCDLCQEEACNGSTLPSPRVFYALLSVLGSLLVGTLYQGA